MKYLKLTTKDLPAIKFRFYEKEASFTCEAFMKILPLEVEALQARVAGKEIWIKDGPTLNIPQENASIHLKIGELGYAPPTPRNKVGRSIAILYGEAKLSDCVNIFAKVFDEDLESLKKLGDRVWMEGKQKIKFELV